MKSREERNKEYYEAEIIPVSKDNYRKIQKLTYKRMVYLPILIISIGGFFALPFCMFFFVAKASLTLSVTVSVFIVATFYLVGPPLYVWTVYRMAKKNSEAAFRKVSYLSQFDSMA